MRNRYCESCEKYPVNWSLRNPVLLLFKGEAIASVARDLFLLNAGVAFNFSSHDLYFFD